MFTADPKITDLKVRDRNVFKVFYSMNIQQVTTPEMSVEDARCYIFYFQEGSQFSAYVGLYLPRLDKRIFYPHSSNPFPAGSLSDIKNEANEFADTMGFLLDEINIKKMSVEDRNRWLDEQDIFNLKRQPESKPAPQPETPSAVAAPRAASSAIPDKATAPLPEPGPQPKAPSREETAASTQPAQAVSAPVVPARATGVPAAVSPYDAVLQQAISAGVVKPPKQPAKKDVRPGAVFISRDKEALARLLSSF